jgi:hypothetical protein
LAVLIALGALAAVTVPRLPAGICYGDAGDLQLAAATLGIAHPPGYAGYVSLGFLLTLTPLVDSAYMVSLGCLGAGLVAIWLCVLMQVRLGANAWVAGMIGVGLTAHPRVWQNLVAPEVYAPTLAFLAGSAYLLLKYARVGTRRDLLLAAVLFGVAAANRPPVLFALPFFAVAGWSARRRWQTSWRRSAHTLLLVAVCVVAPAMYTVGFLWVRDTPQTAYNYIEQYNSEHHELPPANAGGHAKLRRLSWHATGQQFQDMFIWRASTPQERSKIGHLWHLVRSKLRWLRHEVGPEGNTTLVIALAIVALGMVVAGRSCPASAWLLGGLAAQSVIFVCAYRVYGQAADLLPLLWAVAVAVGAALSPLVPPGANRARRLAVMGLLIVVCVWTAVDAADRPNEARAADASAFVRAMDLATFPAEAVIYTSWETSPPLWYAQHVMTGRRDLRIVNARAANWLRMIEDHPGRPVFFTSSRARLPEGYELKPFRKVWRLEREPKASRDRHE